MAGRTLGQLRDRFAEQRPPALTGDHVVDWDVFMAWVQLSGSALCGKRQWLNEGTTGNLYGSVSPSGEGTRDVSGKTIVLG